MLISRIVKEQFKHQPLQLILIIAIILRLLAAIFSKGFGMHDDHFLVIEPAQAWADGINYQGWLPGGRTNVQPDGHSLLYSGLHFLFFWCCNAIGLSDPQIKMLIVRAIHAFFSLLIVGYGYKIARKISTEEDAKTTGLLLALLWFFPMLGVRNLVEIVCIPFLMAAIYELLKAEESGKPLRKYLLAGIIIGIGFSIRFQSAVFISGVGLVLLILGKWKPTLVFSLGVLLAIIPVQGAIDFFVWGFPFAELGEYIRYNLEAANDYITGPWYNYILLIAGILLPPISFFLLAGFFKVWKKHLLIWLPSVLFLVFHSIFPNKQERFIFPILPFVIILGTIGWNELIRESKFWLKHKTFLKGSWILFWVLNSLLLIGITFSYSKRSRVEVMSYLSRYKNIDVMLLEDTNHGSAKMLPQFYSGQWMQVISKTNEGISWHCSVPDCDSTDIVNARFVCFFEETNLDKRIETLKETLPQLEYETTIYPGYIDKVMFFLNPVNLNQTIIVYRNKAFFPEKVQ
ncbi:MAG: glycosyltransferase family 39 protein [Bacteroidales bacterium]|nr:glycosyltransferase family 39 protein [Bacteroidales bacterium]